MYRVHRRRPGADERETPSIWDSSEAWAACAKALREYDEDMIQDWKEEIDTLLVFAGLFSAVVTAFNIEAYQLLQQQPEDSVTAILTQISSQLNSFSVSPNFVNSTQQVTTPGAAPFQPSAFAVRLNTMWFSSLVCSLLSASLGLLVKQWLREYLAGSANISRESIRIRQYRYEGLRRWYVPEIILCLPILLQAALILFFIGLIDMLWTLHPIVASVVTAIVSVSMLFATTTSLLPPLCPDCPYKSPQSWVICVCAQSAKRSATALASRYYASLYNPSYAQPQGYTTVFAPNMHGAATPDPFASRVDLRTPTSVAARLSAALASWLHRVSLARTYASWKEREKLQTETGRRAAALDDATLAGADEMFMDDAFLDAVVRPCMRDIAPRAALRCLDRILLRRAPRVINDMPYWDLARSLDDEGGSRGDTGTLTLMNLLLDVLHRMNASRMSEVELEGEGEDEDGESDAKDDGRRRVLMTMHRLLRAIPGPGPTKSAVTTQGSSESQNYRLFRRMFEVLAGVIEAEVGRAAPERYVRERSFNLMQKLFPRFQAVGPACIMAFCAYSNQARVETAPYRFVQACCMVIRASAVLARDARSRSPTITAGIGSNDTHAPAPLPLPLPEPHSLRPYTIEREASLPVPSHNVPSPYAHTSRSANTSDVTLTAEPLHTVGEVDDDASAVDEYAFVRPAVLRVIDELEGFLSVPVARTAEFRPTTAMLAECAQAVHALAVRDRAAVRPTLVTALGQMVDFAMASARSDFGYAGVHGQRDVPPTTAAMYDSCRGRELEQESQSARQAVRLLRRMYGMRLYDGTRGFWECYG